MKTKSLAALLCLLFACNVTFAQDEQPEEKVHNHELILNIKQAVNIFFYPMQTVHDPYMLQYRHYIKNSAFRAGLGLSFNDSETKNDTMTHPSISSTFDMRMGWQFNEEVGERFVLYYGADFFVHSRSSESEYYNNTYGIIKSDYQTLELGLAPVLGVQFYITPRVSLGTETNYRVALAQTKNQTTYERNRDNQTTESNGISSTYWPPSSLYLNIRF